MTGQRVAGVLYLVSAAAALVAAGSISYAQVVLGVLLLVVREQDKAGILRLFVFAWVVFSLVMVVVAFLAAGAWLPLIGVVLFGGGIAALMLEQLSQVQVYALAAVASTGLLFQFVV